MCHHYRATLALPDGFIAEFFLPISLREFLTTAAGKLPDRGAWPLKAVPAIRLDAAGEPEAFAPEWGLLPRWWKPSDKAPRRASFQRKTINARSETAAAKPAFRDAWKRRRCLLPCEAFFERGHFFDLGEPIAFAGLWESWLGSGDEGEIETATLLTTEPCAEVRGVGHHRMPCLLTTPDERRRWLAGESAGLLSPLADGRLGVVKFE